MIEKRNQLYHAIRKFFASSGYIEVETPRIVFLPGMETNLFPFETRLVGVDGKKIDAGLITSPEFQMKKLLARGHNKIFDFGKCFRNNEQWGGLHSPEFTMLEWYSQGSDYRDGMNETENLIRYCAKYLLDSEIIEYQGKKIDLSKSWQRLSLKDLFLEYFDLDLDNAQQIELLQACKKQGYDCRDDEGYSDLFHRLFLGKIEPDLPLDQFVFVYDYPAPLAALSRLTPDGKYAERFELYGAGIELCNAFTELVDPVEQRKRFQEEQEERRRLGKTVYPIDEDLLNGLGLIQNPTFGNALGVDRLLMLLTDSVDIDDVLLFPVSELFKGN